MLRELVEMHRLGDDSRQRAGSASRGAIRESPLESTGEPGTTARQRGRTNRLSDGGVVTPLPCSSMNLIGRLLTPEELGPTVVFLASPASTG